MFPSSQAEWVVLTEWATIDEALADGSSDEVSSRYSDAFGDGLSRLEHHVGALSATLLNATNWTV